MVEVQESVEVNVPLQTAYNQWTQFEEFPQFMEGVESVKQLDDTRLHWVAEIGGKRHEWDAEITHQEPERRVAWRSVDGKYNSGKGDLKRFKELIETRGRESGSWRGQIQKGGCQEGVVGVAEWGRVDACSSARSHPARP